MAKKTTTPRSKAEPKAETAADAVPAKPRSRAKAAKPVSNTIVAAGSHRNDISVDGVRAER